MLSSFPAGVDKMLGKQSVIEDPCGAISLTATLAKSALVLLVQYSKRSVSNRVKLPLDADVGAVLSLSPLILKLEMQGSQSPTQYYRELLLRSTKSRSAQKNQ